MASGIPRLPGQDTPCPVPPAQRPLQEYAQLTCSWFFAWPAGDAAGLWRALTFSWLGGLPLTLLVAGGSIPLNHDPPRLAIAAAAAALLLPLFLLLRQWLGWTYVHRRLLAERVEYEESGWYDGQVWEKPISWRQQDLLVARHQVQPVLARLRRAIAVATGLLLLGTGLCQAL
ncbi:MAG: hypothetical protein ER33_12440 [Cyanobium sp. CACIAM 14]|nr:MAG: hypothetical protein ER33_12440 [Cyanobium sp. CACIAM 14]